MLTSFHIKNYALIDALNVQFSDGLTIITGETGAGKSILLGGLALVLGKRADLSQVKNRDDKCIIEAVFNVENYNLKPVYQSLDIDYEAETIVRREILPSGKSRAFINDTPVTLESLVTLSGYLIDIHSQYQTQQLTQDNYQFKVIDALAKNELLLHNFSKQLHAYKTLQNAINALKHSKNELIKDYEYNLFLSKELEALDLETLNLEDLETQYEALNNVELIGEKLSTTRSILNAEDIGLIEQLNTVKQELSKISSFSDTYYHLKERVASVGIELDDILLEIDNLQSHISADPQALDQVATKLQAINNLLQKHAVSEIGELLKIKNQLRTKIDDTESLDETIANKEKELEQFEKELEALALKIHNNREKIIPVFISKLEAILKDLGMPNAKFKIELEILKHYAANGKDRLQFLFTANKGSKYNALKKSASGGELSRIMLAIKSILADYVQLPAIMFDEIDTGVSGEVSHKMGDIMKKMSQNMQVFAITHLPQIAAKGDMHFKVFKTDTTNQTHTQLKKITEEARLIEIAQMLGGLKITESAVQHAKQLLN